MSVVSGQLIRGPPGWTYYNPLIQSPYVPMLDGSSPQQKDPCLRELKGIFFLFRQSNIIYDIIWFNIFLLSVTSQRLKETSGVIGHLKSQLNG